MIFCSFTFGIMRCGLFLFCGSGTSNYIFMGFNLCSLHSVLLPIISYSSLTLAVVSSFSLASNYFISLLSHSL